MVSSGCALVDGLLDVFRYNRELVAGGRTVDVDRDQKRAVILFGEVLGELAGAGGLTRALEADDHDDGGRLVGKTKPGGVGAEDLHQLVADDLDDLLRGRQGLEHFLAHGFLADPLDELLDYLEVDVGFEQSDTDLPQSNIHVLCREFAFSAQVLENALELIRKVVKHLSSLKVGSDSRRAKTHYWELTSLLIIDEPGNKMRHRHDFRGRVSGG